MMVSMAMYVPYVCALLVPLGTLYVNSFRSKSFSSLISCTDHSLIGHICPSQIQRPCYSFSHRSSFVLMSSINKQSNGRRKMGPPTRKHFSVDPSQEQHIGRVTVYCVGGGLDLQGLRAHVFRRGFSGTYINEKNVNASMVADAGSEVDLSNMMLSRNVASEKDVDDEVLHVTNSPLLTSLSLSMNDVLTENAAKRRQQVSLVEERDESDEDEKELVKRNMVMFQATQDIFYFDYGCVVFWGLSPQEERAALSELAPFTIECTSADELKNSYDTMEYIYDRKANPQRPIRFDRMKVRTLNIEEKLSLSYGMAQSSKLFVLESRVLQSIEMTRYLPKVHLGHHMLAMFVSVFQ